MTQWTHGHQISAERLVFQRATSHFVGPLRDCIVGGARDEAKGALRAYHEALDDLDGVVDGEVHQRVERVACGALDGKLAPDERAQLPVSLHTPRQGHDAIHQLLVALRKQDIMVIENCSKEVSVIALGTSCLPEIQLLGGDIGYKEDCMILPVMLMSSLTAHGAHGSNLLGYLHVARSMGS